MSTPFGLDPEKAPAHLKASLEPIIRFFSYHDAHPVALGMVLLEKFGTEWLEWDAEVLKHEIIETFKATSVSEHNWQKIQAIRVMMLAISPWKEWHVFEKVIQAVNNNIPDPFVLQHCNLPQLMAGVDILGQIREEEFSDEIRQYIAACALESGVTYLPPPIAFAQAELSQPSYRCKDCGNVDELTHWDLRCDVCCERYTHDRPLSGKPNPELHPDKGKNIEMFLVRDSEAVRARFEQLKGLSEADINPENSVDVQAAKLAVAHRYMIQRQKELIAQLEELKSWVTH
jgi:hypothetical protein